MSLDSTFLSALCNELNEELTGGKIEKVQQPGKGDIVLSVRCNDGRKDVFIGGVSGSGRINITTMNYEKPQEPPMFCMLLRKHLTGARINEIIQPENERIVICDMDAPGMFGEGEKRKLIMEFFGRATNIILTDGEGVITDCLHRIGGANEKRAVLPGMKYRLPPGQNKISLASQTVETIYELFSEEKEDELFDKWLIKTFYGFSPLTSREVCMRASGEISVPFYRLDREKAAEEIIQLADKIKNRNIKPYILYDNYGVPFEFSYIPICQYGIKYSLSEVQSFSELLDIFWGKRNEEERLRQYSSFLLKTVKTLRDRTERRIIAQREELSSTSDRERWRKDGDIITSNIHLMKKGMTVLKAVDYYSEDNSVREIPLDPLKTPQQNAAKYYRDYSKAKSAVVHLTQQIEKGESELDYLDSVLDEIIRIESSKDLDEIKSEMIDAGIIKEPAKKKKRPSSDGPMRFRSDSGMLIRVGRNNIQNEALTLKNSSRDDMWFHAQKIHGSHVSIACEGSMPDDTTIAQAASLAAYYSQARDNLKVPVDYTQIKHVKKPGGSRPGMVVYTDYKTILVRPDKNLAERLRVKS